MPQRSLFDPPPPPETPTAGTNDLFRVLTVSELNQEVKNLLEGALPAIWVEGEISNLTTSTAGHSYFSLKDEKSQIRVVLWKYNRRYLKCVPQNGMRVKIQGRIVVYEPRGEYQIDLQQMVPFGKGDLHLAFEELKERLRVEGLFDPKRKRPMPLLPKKIGIVTSPSGAVIRDILKILNQRFMNLHVVIFPSKVQGDDAAPMIVEGIQVLNRITDIDVVILARGGGSIEDLWPFNEEAVARAIVASRIPVISAIGHETDTTISDFAADLRAPTPSAAAEQVIGKKSEFVNGLNQSSQRMQGAMKNLLLQQKNKIVSLSRHRALIRVPQNIRTFQQSVDDYVSRLIQGLSGHHRRQFRRFQSAKGKLSSSQLRHLIESKRTQRNNSFARMEARIRSKIAGSQKQAEILEGKLHSLSPLAVLDRGYSITLDMQGHALKESSQTTAGDLVQIRLHQGSLRCEVKEVKT